MDVIPYGYKLFNIKQLITINKLLMGVLNFNQLKLKQIIVSGLQKKEGVALTAEILSRSV